MICVAGGGADPRLVKYVQFRRAGETPYDLELSRGAGATWCIAPNLRRADEDVREP